MSTASPPSLLPTRPSPQLPFRSFSAGSNFSDSAIHIDMESTTPTTSTPTKIQYDDGLSSEPSLSLEERLLQLAAVARAAEQDEQLDDEVTNELHSKLDTLSICLENGGVALSATASRTTSLVTDTIDPDSISEQCPRNSPAGEVLSHLSTTVSSLRLRLQEHRHMHEVFTEKLEATAQHCLVQKRAIQDLDRDIKDLRRENNVLGSQNDGLRSEVAELQSEVAENEVAVKAMTGAVAGLEGWIEDRTPREARHGLDLVKRRSEKSDAIRGQGRFRGRYALDSIRSTQALHGLDGVEKADGLELEEGIKAWLRGFRDVEEGLRARGSGQRPDLSLRANEIEEVRADATEVDWGNFEIAG